MEKYSAILIDDEEPGRRNLAALLEKYCPEINVVGEASSAMQAKERIQELHPDILFLDINMPELNGFDLLETIDRKKFAVVFSVKKPETNFVLRFVGNNTEFSFGSYHFINDV